MKQASRKLTILALCAALSMPAIVIAQPDEKAKKKDDVEQITIIRKGDKTEKVVVEIVGDKITVNGKPIEELKDDDVSVHRSRYKDVYTVNGLNALRATEAMKGNELLRYLSVDSNRAMLGVSTERGEKGVVINEVTKGSAAEKAGFKQGDVLIKIDDTKLEEPDQLSSVIKKKKAGDKVNITYLRESKENKVAVELGKYKGSNIFSAVPGQGFKMDMDNFHFENVLPRAQNTPSVRTPYTNVTGAPRLGLSVQDAEDGKGVKVINVASESNAAKAGLKEDDVITEIDGKVVNNADEVAKIIRDSKDKNSVMMKLSRNGKTQNIEVKIPRKLKTATL